MAGSAFFTLLSVIMVCVTYEPESFIDNARILAHFRIPALT